MGVWGAGWDHNRHPEELGRAQAPRVGDRYRITYERRDSHDRICFGYAATWVEVKRAVDYLRRDPNAWYPKVTVL